MGNLPFRPMIGLEHNILESPENQRNGLLGIATDTNRIYYGKDNRMHLIGSKSNIYYGNMYLSETPDEKQEEFLFTLEQIEGNEFVEDGNYTIPNESDLILNVDGCFYKVIEIISDGNSTTLNTKKLTISGTGGGGGGGNTPGTSSKTAFNRITNRNIEVLYGGSCEIWYEFLATDSSGEQTGPGQIEVVVNGVSAFKEKQEQGKNFVDVGKYLSLAENQSVVIKITVDTGTGTPTTMTKSWSVTTRNITLEWNYNETTINTEDNITLAWTVKGSGLKTTYIIINEDNSNPITVTSDSTTLQTYTLNRNQYGLTHGVHSIKMYVQVQIGGSEIPPTESIVKYFICADEDEQAIIIANLLKTNETTQYDTLKIPLVIYNPTSDTSTVELYNDIHDTDPIDTWKDVLNATEKIWMYTPVAAGEKRLKVRCGSTNLIINLNVASIGADISEVSNYALKLKASELTSNDALRALTQADGTKLLTFNNFDWIRGGLRSELDENGNSRQYICIPAGSSMTVNYALLSKEAATYGKNIKIIFKAVNCRNYDGNVMQCGNILSVNAQSASLAAGSTEIEIPYCEDTYLELEYDIWAVSDKADDKYRYIVGWLDGVPCCASTYVYGSLFATNETMVIGSEDCDVYLYLLKSYDRHLSNDEHIKNFIADAPNSNEMLARYHRNDILDENGEISYLKLAKAAPECRVHVYDIPRMTENKNDKVNGCSYTMYHGSSDAVISSNKNVTIRVQGTSSAAYGIAAFNIDSDFSDAIDAGEFKIEELTDAVLGNKAIPCDYFTTKVNVASCEGANNALNQEWYNLHQPYKMALRKKNADGGWNNTGRLYRDTMQFEPGVMFVIDRNEITNAGNTKDNVFKDTPGYIANPYPKMYSVCNMGNSKKNIQVFHNEANPNECCVEVADNQLPEQRMLYFRDAFKWNDAEYAWTSLGIDGTSDAKIFEFRYPDAKDTYKEGTQEQKEAMDKMRANWERFFRWMGECNLQPYDEINNPTGYTGEKFSDGTQKEFGPFTVTQEGILKGVSITDYVDTYTEDTKEYRMAKMLSECENYLCLDSVVYHYLMIERHSMIDNVAKNTFWSTEDGLHWNLNKDYDNDTADGIDNNGVLKLTYGIEGGDLDSAGTSYFNAGTAVWFNFIKELLPLQTAMYIALDTTHTDDFGNVLESAWDATAYLNKFTKWQNCIPERCWVEDYYRKYFRPMEVYSDPSYLPRLDGGKKTHQRKQYEIYQHNYIDSKFGGRTTLSGNIQLRANATAGNISVPMEFYADCYLNAAIGSGTGEQTAINFRKRIKRNTPVDFSFPIMGDLTDATCYFYLPQYYTKIGDLSVFKPKLVSITNAQKLREITLGNQIENNETDAVITISAGAVPLLEKLIAKNIKNLKSDSTGLDLSTAYSLKELDLSGSAFGGLQLPDGAPLETIRLNEPTVLTANNLYKLNTFNVANCASLTNIQLDNVDGGDAKMSQIIINALKQTNTMPLIAYKLHNINWDINNSADIIEEKVVEVSLTESTYEDGKYYILTDEGEYQLANNGYQENVTYYEITHYIIPLFDYLLQLTENRSDVTKPPHEPWMTGNVNVSSDAYNLSESIGFYNKYMINGVDNDTTKRYPAVNLIFEGENAKLYDVNIYYGGEDDNRIWSKKAVNNTALNGTFLATGPSGAFDIDEVRKDSSLQYNYVFTGTWNIYNADTGALLNSNPITDLNNSGISINCNLKVLPIFTEVIRKYPVIIYNDDGITVLQDLTAEENWVEYGTTVDTILSKTIPTSTQDENTLALNEIYMFKGYAAIKGSTTVIANDYRIEGKETLYAVYNKMNIYNTDFSKYFTYELDSYTDKYDANYNIPANEGYSVTINSDYALSGKILIPSYFNNKPIIKINTFNSNQKLTHIFVNEDSELRSIANDALKITTLKYFDFNNAIKLRHIGAQAFRGAHLDMNLNPVCGGPNTYYIGDRTFYQCLTNFTQGQPVQIPASVVEMSDQAFMGYNSMNNSAFIIGSPDEPSLLDLGKSIDHDNDNYVRIEAKDITFYSKIYTSSSDIIKENSLLTVESFLYATNGLNIIPIGG